MISDQQAAYRSEENGRREPAINQGGKVSLIIHSLNVLKTLLVTPEFKNIVGIFLVAVVVSK